MERGTTKKRTKAYPKPDGHKVPACRAFNAPVPCVPRCVLTAPDIPNIDLRHAHTKHSCGSEDPGPDMRTNVHRHVHQRSERSHHFDGECSALMSSPSTTEDFFFFWLRPKMSWRSPLTSQYSR